MCVFFFTRESVESKAVKQSIDSFSSNVKEQLLEKVRLSQFYLICDAKELRQESSWTLQVFQLFLLDT